MRSSPCLDGKKDLPTTPPISTSPNLIQPKSYHPNQCQTDESRFPTPLKKCLQMNQGPSIGTPSHPISVNTKSLMYM